MIGSHVHPLNSLATQQVPIGGAQVIAKLVEFTNVSLQETLNGFHKQLTTQGGGFVSFGGQQINVVWHLTLIFPLQFPYLLLHGWPPPRSSRRHKRPWYSHDSCLLTSLVEQLDSICAYYINNTPYLPHIYIIYNVNNIYIYTICKYYDILPYTYTYLYIMQLLQPTPPNTFWDCLIWAW